jgi:hypothetical protein
LLEIFNVHLYQLNQPREFSLFFGPKIHVSPTSVVSSLSPLWCRLSSSRCHHAAAPCHASFPLSQDELAAFASSSENALSHCLPSRAETEALNLHQYCMLPSPDRWTPTLHCYKKIISILATLPTTQPRLYFASSLARTPRHRSSTHRRSSLSPLSYTHRPSAQRYPRWWTSRPSFTFRIT